jgi:hypothetical protein
MEGYSLLVVEDETGTFEQDDYVKIDEVEDAFDMNGNSFFSFGGGVAVGSLIGAYIGYKVGRARGKRKGGTFDTEKKIYGKVKKKFAGGGNVSSIEKKVTELNRLIELANEKGISVVDSSSTWQSPMKYKPIRYSNGVLYVEYQELDLYKYNRTGSSNWVTKKDKVLKRNMQFDNPLNEIAKMYRKALKSDGIEFAGGGGVDGDELMGEQPNSSKPSGYIVTDKRDKNYNQLGNPISEISVDKSGKEYITLDFGNGKGISTYSLYDLQKQYDNGGGVGDTQIYVYSDMDSETGLIAEIENKKFDNLLDAKNYAKMKGYKVEIVELHYGNAYKNGGGVDDLKINSNNKYDISILFDNTNDKYDIEKEKIIYLLNKYSVVIDKTKYYNRIMEIMHDMLYIKLDYSKNYKQLLKELSKIENKYESVIDVVVFTKKYDGGRSIQEKDYFANGGGIDDLIKG